MSLIRFNKSLRFQVEFQKWLSPCQFQGFIPYKGRQAPTCEPRSPLETQACGLSIKQNCFPSYNLDMSTGDSHYLHIETDTD